MAMPIKTQTFFKAAFLGCAFFIFFTNFANAATTSCDSCASCQAAIDSAVAADVIKINRDIWNAVDLSQAKDYSGTACLVLYNKTNIEIDCDKHVIDGTGGNLTFGIYLRNGGPNKVSNCYVTGFFDGILNYGSKIILNDSETNYNGEHGVYILTGPGNNFLSVVKAKNNTSNGINIANAGAGNLLSDIWAINNNGQGIYSDSGAAISNSSIANNSAAGIDSRAALTISDNKIYYNNNGVSLNTGGNILFNNIIKWNTTKDVVINGGNGNKLYGNQFLKKSLISDSGFLTHWNDYSVTDIKPGNHWDAYDQPAENCFDNLPAVSPDGYCDSAYTLIPNNFARDNFPKAVGSISAFYCDSCSDCNSKIGAAKSGDTVYLANNINNVAADCLNLSNKQNITFDCQKYKITATAVNINGIYLNNGGLSGSNTVKRCELENFTKGLNIINSDNNIFTDNIIKKNVIDVYISASKDNLFYNNIFFDKNKLTIENDAKNNNWYNGTTGNHWLGYDSPGEGCADVSPQDGYCDDKYDLLPGGPSDNHALSTGSQCGSCEECNQKIQSALPGEEIILSGNIKDATGSCIDINNKQNITFNCNNLAIDGTKTGNGIYVYGGAKNITLKNCLVTNFDNGVYIKQASNNNLENMRAESNNYGINLENSGANVLNSISANLNNNGLYYINASSTANNINASYNKNWGIKLNGSSLNNFTNISANNNGATTAPGWGGIYLQNSSFNTFDNAAVKNNISTGIYFVASSNNTVKNSAEIRFNPTNIYIDNNSFSNKFFKNKFISKAKIVNNSVTTIWDDGASGNWWESYDSDDEDCYDNGSGSGVAGDLICDSPYAIGLSKDIKPAWKKSAGAQINCSDCSSCNAAVAGAEYGDIVKLGNNAFYADNADCLTFGAYKEGVTFDGGDYLLSGNSNNNGIVLQSNSENNRIKNISLTNFNYGIKFNNNAKRNYVQDSSIFYTDDAALYFDGGSENILTGTTISYNILKGADFRNNSSLNQLSYFNFSNNSGKAVYFDSSGSNTIASSTIKGNAIDAYMLSGNSNLFYNNQFTSKDKITSALSVITKWDNGVKGNWWEAYDTEAEFCYDDGLHGGSNSFAGDKLCDNFYLLNLGRDNKPQYKGGAGKIYSCSSCSECNNLVNSAEFGDKIQLTQDIFGSAGTCIILQYKQGITFDCQNHFITGRNISNTYGIYVKGNSQNDYFKVENCKIKNFYKGIFISFSSANAFNNITLDNNMISGISLAKSSLNNFDAISISNQSDLNDAGMELYNNSKGNTIKNLSTDNNYYGLKFYTSSSDNTITFSTIKANYTNISIDGNSNNNIFYSNEFISKVKMSDASASTHWNKWDSVGGNQKPGNHWEIYDSTVEGCVNNNEPNYCDAPYLVVVVLAINNNDNYPLYYGIVNSHSCGSCSSCNTEIKKAYFGETVKLTNNIASEQDNCLEMKYKEGITLDCAGKKITGKGITQGFGIKIKGSSLENNTIQNCAISNFMYGIYAANSSKNIYQNTSANQNGIGLSFDQFASTNVSTSLIKNFTANSNGTGYSFRTFSDFNILTGITAKNNNFGIDIYSKSNNINNSDIEYNNFKGIIIKNNDNIASTSIIKYNGIDIEIPGSGYSNNLFYYNELNSKTTITDLGTNTKWDNGAIDGGNHWEAFDENSDCYLDGVTKCCTGSGVFCGNDYKIDNAGGSDGGISIDNYPRMKSSIPAFYDCSGCLDCNNKIASASAGDTIRLTKDIIGASGNCIDFGDKNGIIFTCQNFIISGNGSGNGFYLHNASSHGNMVKECEISSFENGIFAEGAAEFNIFSDLTLNNNNIGLLMKGGNDTIKNNLLKNIIAQNNNAYGLSLGGSGVGSIFKDNILENIKANSNSQTGIYLILSNNNTIKGCQAFYNNKGLVLGGDANTITEGAFKWNTVKDIAISSGATGKNIFYSNELTSKNKIEDNGVSTYWNNYDSGNKKPGNHWEYYDQLGDTDGNCADIQPIVPGPDGYCDNRYEVKLNTYDYYPKAVSSVSVFYCNSCSDCNGKIAAAAQGSTVNLANGISPVAGDCISLLNKKKITFDCRGYAISAAATGTGNGVYFNNGGGDGSNIVKNCVIDNFDKGIYILSSDNNIVASSTIKTNTRDLEINNTSDNNVIYGNELLDKNKILDNGGNTHWNNWNSLDIAQGNHWQGYDEPLESCDNTAPVDYFCDLPYNVSTAQDKYPKYAGAADNFACNSCSECNSKINSAAAGATIKLTKNIIDVTGSCLEFNGKSNLTFDCQNFAIKGKNLAGSDGVLIKNNSTNIILENCKVFNFNYGAHLASSNSNQIKNSEFSNNIIRNASQVGIGVGIQAEGSNSNIFENVIANGSAYGLSLFNSDTSEVKGSEFKYNRVNIKIDVNSSANKFYNNHLISKSNMEDDGAGTLWDNGIGIGNWWEVFDWGDEGCVDNGSSICVNDYKIKTAVYDHYPQFKGLPKNQDKPCHSCQECNNALNEAFYGEKIILQNDISSQSICIEFPQYHEGLTLDCANKFISGSLPDSTYDETGIYITGSSTVNYIVDNCVIMGFDYGILIADAGSVQIMRGAVNYSGFGAAVAFGNPYNIIFSDFEASRNEKEGISFTGQSSRFNNITLKDNGGAGIVLNSKGSNIFSADYANIISNNMEGIKINCAANKNIDTIASSSIKGNSWYDAEIVSACPPGSLRFYNNEFISRERIKDSGVTTEWFNGTEGNWWEAYDTDLECYDGKCCTDSAPNNLVCDNNYEVAPGQPDNFPKYRGAGFNKQDISCSDCDDCNNKIFNGYFGEKITLSQNAWTDKDCLKFSNKQGITFDCGSYSITGQNQTGISIVNSYLSDTMTASNTVENCVLNNFEKGVYVNSNNNKLFNLAISSLGNISTASNTAIYMARAKNNSLQTIKTDFNEIGIVFDNSNSNFLKDIKLQNNFISNRCTVENYYGLLFLNSHFNMVTESDLRNYWKIVVFSGGSANNKFYNNHFSLFNAISNIIGNSGANIWSEGNEGNWWESFDTGDEGCYDGDNNSICDNNIAPHNDKPYFVDPHPKYKGIVNNYTCTGCSDCNEKIKNARYGDTVKLTKDISNQPGDCLVMSYKQGVTFDGSGCSAGECVISGGGGNSVGFSVCGHGIQSNKIKNLSISNFDIGVGINSSDWIYLENIKANYNEAYGIYITGQDKYGSGGSLLTNIEANYNNNDLDPSSGGGVAIIVSSDIKLKNVDASYNYNYYNGSPIVCGAVSINFSSRNILEDVSANYNKYSASCAKSGGITVNAALGYGNDENIFNGLEVKHNGEGISTTSDGIYIKNSNKNKIYDSIITNNTKNGLYFDTSNENNIYSNTVKNNSGKDVKIASGDDNVFYSNEFISNAGMEDNSVKTHWNFWTGLANAEPGNHWEAYDTATECCYDDGAISHAGCFINAYANASNPAINDGYCDNKYEVKPTLLSLDYYPLTFAIVPVDFEIANAVISNCKITISWQVKGDAEKYVIWRSVDGGAYAILTEKGKTDVYVEDVGDYNKSYSYKVEAVNGANRKFAFCNNPGFCQPPNETKTFYPTICAVDLSLAQCAAAGTATLGWNGISSASGYYILRSDDGVSYDFACNPAKDFKSSCGNIYNMPEDGSSPYSFTDTKSLDNKIYYYKVWDCAGDCSAFTKCEPVDGSRNNCYVESQVKTKIQCSGAVLIPVWKEVKP